MGHPLEKPRQQGHKFGKRVLLWLAIIGVILIGVVGLMFSSITLLLKSEGWVAHSYQVLDTLDLTEAYYTDAQSAERGYAATCKPAMLSPFHRDLPQIFSDVATLRHLTADNPLQQGRASALSKAISGELERMSGVITTTTAGHQLQAENMWRVQRTQAPTAISLQSLTPCRQTNARCCPNASRISRCLPG